MTFLLLRIFYRSFDSSQKSRPCALPFSLLTKRIYFIRTMVQYKSEHLVSHADEFDWDEDPSMVIDLDDDDLFSCTGHDSFMSFCENECESTARWKTNLLIHTDIYDSMKRDDRRIDFATKNMQGLSKHVEGSLKPQMAGRPIPLVDMLGEIFSTRTMELKQQQYETVQTQTEKMMNTNKYEGLTSTMLDEQLEIAQRKLEESIRRSQITRPKFIQFSESMMKNEASCKLLLSLKSNPLKQCTDTSINSN